MPFANDLKNARFVDQTERRALISVCIPVYNGMPFVRETILSVLGNYPRLEIVVQDNLSTDGSWELLQKMAEEHSEISLSRNKQFLSMAGNWNAAIDRACGDYVMLLSADDLLEYDFFDTCLETFETHPTADIVTCEHWLLCNGVRRSRKIAPIVYAGMHENFAAEVLLLNPFSINFSLFRRSVLEGVKKNGQLFSMNLMSCDYELWLRVALGGVRVFFLKKHLASYRIHSSNLSHQRQRMLRHALGAILAHRRELVRLSPLALKVTFARFWLRTRTLKKEGRDARVRAILRGELCR